LQPATGTAERLKKIHPQMTQMKTGPRDELHPPRPVILSAIIRVICG
jgi:hypothetical protein